MASNQETGIAINIANFKLQIEKCATMGVPYNPSNADLSIVNMTSLWVKADTAHVAYTTAFMNSKNGINSREILFKSLNKLVTKTINYFKSTKASKQIKLDAKGLGDKIRGFGVKVKKLPDGTPDPDYVSNSHQSFVQRADAFKQLIVLYASDGNYKPNENEITITTLETLQLDMKNLNDSIGAVLGPKEAAKILRDHLLDDEEVGLLDMAFACKAYVKAVFGASSPEAKSIAGIKFRRRNKK
jgi:hypothetical protein